MGGFGCDPSPSRCLCRYSNMHIGSGSPESDGWRAADAEARRATGDAEAAAWELAMSQQSLGEALATAWAEHQWVTVELVDTHFSGHIVGWSDDIVGVVDDDTDEPDLIDAVVVATSAMKGVRLLGPRQGERRRIGLPNLVGWLRGAMGGEVVLGRGPVAPAMVTLEAIASDHVMARDRSGMALLVPLDAVEWCRFAVQTGRSASGAS